MGQSQSQRQSQMVKCEDCGKVRATFGLPGERSKRWCAGCGKGHGAVRIQQHKMCEVCGLARA